MAHLQMSSPYQLYPAEVINNLRACHKETATPFLPQSRMLVSGRIFVKLADRARSTQRHCPVHSRPRACFCDDCYGDDLLRPQVQFSKSCTGSPMHWCNDNRKFIVVRGAYSGGRLEILQTVCALLLQVVAAA